MKDEILAAVDREYAADPLSAVTWENPHPDLEVRDEEYSRVTDPERFRIVGARVDAWERALVGLRLAHSEPIVTPSSWRQSPSQEAVLLTPEAEGARALVMAKGAFDDTPATVLIAGTGGGEHGSGLREIGDEPDCACDGCDGGSDRLLEAVDELVWSVVGGFVRVWGDGWFAEEWEDRMHIGRKGRARIPYPQAEIFDRARAGKITRETVIIGEAW
ncbi:hypothetical protein BJF89_05685 [Corynebacterium sp. CNJ-954]|uniref:DUF6226 family protein n=1 Tax=Corynebacterium sp. CNJ-954 TaxID=1904962 RepID=UPI0009696CF3|nr:DUF6226 family protein [Corynebacterium sp. CNJ-954]OLT51935.1 hypothetical protein BJF89_05685 [Corynebacterium sp. CNJ-954]